MKLSDFQNPETMLRPAPFWAINSEINPQETADQIRAMRKVGLSGAFFHSRSGLITDYLGEDWFQCMKSALEEAKKTGGYIWLYDEDLWPSGSAGGLVAATREEYRCTTIRGEFIPSGEVPEKHTEGKFCKAYLIKREGIQLISADIISEEEASKNTNEDRLILREYYAPKTGWWGGESYANLLNPDAVKEFMKRTHEVYREKLSDEFGKTIPGIFTDEPTLVQGPRDLAWYDGLPEVYEKATKRNLWEDLPFVFFEGSRSRKVRLLVHRTILHHFCKSYDEPIYQWCKKNGLELTGHYNNEDSFISQIRAHCGSVMAHYRYQQSPGIDHLLRVITPDLLTVKQVSSAARQLGRKRILTEIFGVSRHTNSFEDYKWLGNYDLALGANFFCPHLFWYSAKGRRKRDFPPCISPQQTYWDELNPLNDYFARISYALTQGKPKVDVLVLHPIESAIASHRIGLTSGIEDPAGRKEEYFGGGPIPLKNIKPCDVSQEDLSAAVELDELFRKSVKAVITGGYDCDLGDETYLDEMGSVNGDKFQVGEMTYSVVVVPPSSTWRPSTFALLKQFAENGGKLIFLGRTPTEIEGDDTANEWQRLCAIKAVRTVPCSTTQIQEAIHLAAPDDFILATADGGTDDSTYHQHRIDGDQDILFVINTNRSHSQNYRLTFRRKAGNVVKIWNTLDGSCSLLPTSQRGEISEATFSIPQSGSILLTVEAKGSESLCQETPDLSRGEILPLSSKWEYSPLDDNVLTMDRISVSLDNGKTWLAEDLDHRIRQRIAGHFGTQDALEWQPWVAIRKGLFEGKGGDIRLRYHFINELTNPHKISLVIEEMTKGIVYVNGEEVQQKKLSSHWDKSFNQLDIASFVKSGENTIEFKVPYDFLTEVEPIYLVGDFGVDLQNPYSGKLIEKPSHLSNGSWVTQGFLFYSGKMSYSQSFELKNLNRRRVFIRLKNPSGILYKIRVNQKDAGRILWHPYWLELTSLAEEGTNNLEIEVISSLQNSWGPHHEKDGEDNLWCGPNAFEAEGLLREELSFFDYGLLGGAEIILL